MLSCQRVRTIGARSAAALDRFVGRDRVRRGPDRIGLAVDDRRSRRLGDVRERQGLDEGQRAGRAGVVPADGRGPVGDAQSRTTPGRRRPHRTVAGGRPPSSRRPVVDDARDVAGTVAPEDIGRVVDDERRRIGRLRGGIGDFDVGGQVIRLPAELEPNHVVAEPMERQLLPLERIGRRRMRATLPWNTKAVRSRAGARRRPPRSTRAWP